nr:MAG TPA_asm: hypothetical protein [Caudoviricetes sp.]
MPEIDKKSVPESLNFIAEKGRIRYRFYCRFLINPSPILYFFILSLNFFKIRYLKWPKLAHF